MKWKLHAISVLLKILTRMYGFMQELSDDQSHYKVEQIFRDSKISEIYEGTNEIQKMIIARNIFGREIAE